MNGYYEIEAAGVQQLQEAYAELARVAQLAAKQPETFGGEVFAAQDIIDWRWQQLHTARKGYPALAAAQVERQLAS